MFANACLIERVTFSVTKSYQTLKCPVMSRNVDHRTRATLIFKLIWVIGYLKNLAVRGKKKLAGSGSSRRRRCETRAHAAPKRATRTFCRSRERASHPRSFHKFKVHNSNRHLLNPSRRGATT
jgi:hypothetical protein